MWWRTRERWIDAKDRTATKVSQSLLEPSRMQNLLPTLYASLGGNEDASSPIVLKGGAAFVLYMTREMAFYGDTLPLCLQSFANAADLDFACRWPAERLMDRTAAALPWLARTCAHVWPSFETTHRQWRLRRDGSHGEAYFDGRRFPLGCDKTEEDLPIKLSFHGGLTEKRSGAEFQLVRIGVAVWHERLRRGAIAAFVDVSLSDASALFSTVCVMGMRVQTPRSMLKALRRMTFHEADYAPWLAACGDEDKQHRRVERLVKLSFVVDWKTMGGKHNGRGTGAARGIGNRWRKALMLMFACDASGLRHLSLSAPPQLRFILLCSARTVEIAAAANTLDDYHYWVDSAVSPMVLDICDDLDYLG